MERVALFVNDEALDLKDGEKISITFQAQSFSKLEDKQGSFSRSFQLPMTDKNKRLLESANVFAGKSTIPYKVITAYLYVNGIMIQPGNLIVENDGVSKNEIRVTYYTGNSNFFQLIKDVKLREIKIPDTEHLYVADNIVSFRNRNDVFYPIIDYTNDNYYITTANDRVYFERILPATLFPAILTGIEKLTGYRFIGNILQQNDFENAFFPTSSIFKRDKKIADRNTWTFQSQYIDNISNIFTDFQLADDVEFTSFTSNPGKYLAALRPDGGTHLPYYQNVGGNKRIQFWDRCRLNIKITAYLKVDFFTKITFYWGEELQPYKEWFVNDPNENEILFTNTPLKVVCYAIETTTGAVVTFNPALVGGYVLENNLVPKGYYNFYMEFQLDTEPHKNIVFNCNSGFAGTPAYIEYPKTECTFIKDNGTTDEDLEVKLWNQNKNNYSNALLNAVTPIPDITISSYIKSILNLFNALIIVDDINRTVNFFTMAELYDKLPYSKNWSEYLINIDDASWNTRANGYGQSSILKYENDDDVSSNLGEYEFQINDTTLPDEKIIIQLPYSASVMRKAFIDNKADMPIIKRFDTTPSQQFGYAKQRILYRKLVSSIPYTLEYKSDVNISPVVITSNINTNVPFCYFNLSTEAYQMGFDVYFYKTYSRYLEYITNNFKQLSVVLLFPPSEISQLDFTKPIYLSQFASYFFIEKIQDWTPGKPCKVVLLKLQ